VTGQGPTAIHVQVAEAVVDGATVRRRGPTGGYRPGMNVAPPLQRGSRKLRIILWIVAFLLMAGVARHQRRTGPTYPLDVEYGLGTSTFATDLVRSGTTGEDALGEIPAPPSGWTATLCWRRYPTADEYTESALGPAEGDTATWVGPLPPQPPAGKVEYFLRFAEGGTTVRVPAEAGDDPVLRFKDYVPLYVLLPHILVMFLSMMVGVRAGLAALFRLQETRRLAWVALGGLTVGGLVLGPIAQKLAFGEYWTGWPYGYDLTDNKALLMWLVWLGACLVLGLKTTRRPRAGRVAVIAAALVMLVVYLIPHSLRGSELDYDRLEEGVPAKDAIRTG